MDKKFLDTLIQKLQKRLLKEVERGDYQFRNTYNELLKMYAAHEGTLFVIRKIREDIKYITYFDILKQLQEVTGLDREEAIYALAGSMPFTLTDTQEVIMRNILGDSGFELKSVGEL